MAKREERLNARRINAPDRGKALCSVECSRTRIASMRKAIALLLIALILLSAVAFAASGVDKDTVKRVQQALNDAGYPCGTADGIAGKKTAAAIRQYQEDHGLEVTGDIDDPLLAAMGMLAEAVPETTVAPTAEPTAEPEEIVSEYVPAPEPPAEEEPEKTMGPLSIGENILFGHYEQDNDESNGPESIEWIVLDVQDGLATLISKYGLDALPYDENLGAATWEKCSLRRWLNEDFLNAAFDPDEQAMLQDRSVSAEKNTVYNTTAGSSTHDRIYLLSMQEAERYLPYEDARICKITATARANGAWKTPSGASFWWLRSPGESQIHAAQVDLYGRISSDGNLVSSKSAVIRPVITVKSGQASGEGTPILAGIFQTQDAETALNGLYARAKQINGASWNAQVLSGKPVIAIYQSTDSTSPAILTATTESDYSFPAEYLAETCETADIVAIVFPTYRTVGSYTNGGDAKNATSWVTFFDLRDGTQYEAIPVKISAPPKTITVPVIGGMTLDRSGYGEYDIQAVLDYIRDAIAQVQ